MWDPNSYLRHADHRLRPFHDLIARIPTPAPLRVLDLGCGPGNATAELADRWPDAHVTGLDNSDAMVASARKLARPGLDFSTADLTTDDWLPNDGADVMVTNAVLHWVPGHLARLPRWTDALTPGGSFAVQVPANFADPAHVLLTELTASARWKDRIGAEPRPFEAHSADRYLDALARPGFRVDAWETTYLHVLHGPDPVLSWMEGTALRPVLAALADADRGEFLAEYGALLADAYPERDLGTVLPFRRVFAVAVNTG
ncbi:methyltransferase domain-containing protein [Yinghuangia sp. ASG 101]|uniref:methyltransferase domain-containing protein n=1 Tax=Yinghuangia sp. ASG 101 TaxID=2896848 RepID=UPI001E336123|nr:methyltransferase domain-containing protein [Yinghuangia sp. ASG 101]UGQ14510.1 methyltransferase domain-containing protein [Yinghuangia sp. ASG 101]